MAYLTGSPIPIGEFASSAGEFDSVVGLPPAAYSDPAFFEFEMEAIYGHEWICVGRGDQIPNPGDFFTITIAGESLIVTRNKAGEVNVMSSVCQHRAMCITAPAQRPQEEWFELPPETSGNCNTFRCPYHWWTYDLDGHLIGAADMDRTTGFDKSDVQLPKLKVELWKGFIFVNFDDKAEALSPRLGRVATALANFHIEEMITVDPMTVPDLPFNWKIMAENFMEGYHPSRLHSGIHDMAPSKNSDFAQCEPGDAGFFGAMGSIHVDPAFNPTSKILFPVIETLTEEERWKIQFAYIPPSLLIGLQPDSAFWFTVQPTSVNSHTLTMAYIFPPSTLELPLFSELLGAAVQGVELFNNQDLPTNTAVQLGMESRFAPRGRYSWQESILPTFNTWLIERYLRADERAGMVQPT